MRQMAVGACFGLGGLMFVIGFYMTLGGGGFTKAESESVPLLLRRVYETVQSGAMMVSGAVFLAGGIVVTQIPVTPTRP